MTLLDRVAFCALFLFMMGVIVTLDGCTLYQYDTPDFYHVTVTVP